MLDDASRIQLQGCLEYLAYPVELAVALDGSAHAQALEALLREVAALAPRIAVVAEADARTPSFAVRRAGPGGRASRGEMRFACMPLGRQFTAFVLALLYAGGQAPKVAPALAGRIAALDGTRRFEAYIAHDCHNCPEVVQALAVLAALNPGIRAVAIDGGWFRAEAEARDVRVVPMVWLDGRHFGQGRLGVERILARLAAG